MRWFCCICLYHDIFEYSTLHFNTSKNFFKFISVILHFRRRVLTPRAQILKPRAQGKPIYHLSPLYFGLKWSGSFLKHNKSFRWHLGDYEKHNFFSNWRPVRGETLIFVCFYGCVVCPAGVWGPAWRRSSLHSAYINRFLTGRLPIRKNTQKSKFLLSQAFKWKQIMFFVIPEMPSCYGFKKTSWSL